ncbi:pleckstrin (PH) domain-containing protein [Tieghemostelium lacteum]|uniref:Pleckstrin (PH) domain-containing protein n=1 Tax=Tieghemostelium lacteum TaxID=361077 RepID=A0A151ZA74_TIELA|nr:pleckstrin (PH) domain-containing protein [Tieghemostelium lacteum]|eukprot:KYQ90850.1 pleckstrin (PH) domain-containing protein [Tieghemostelium lacteum]
MSNSFIYYHQQKHRSLPTCYENKENFGTPIPKFNFNSQDDKRPLSPQPMVMSPPKNQILENVNNNQKQQQQLSPQPMVMSPPKPQLIHFNLSNEVKLKLNQQQQQQQQQHHTPNIQSNSATVSSTLTMMLPPQQTISTPKRPQSIFESTSRHLSTPIPMASNHFELGSNINNNNNNYNNNFQQQRNKTVRRSIKDEEDGLMLSERKKEDRKSRTLQKQTSKRELSLQQSRQQYSSTPVPLTSPMEQKELDKKRLEVIKEIQTSEQSYGTHLNHIVDLYLLPLRKEYTTPEEVKYIVSIFSNIESIRIVNRNTMQQFKERFQFMNPNVPVSDLFISMIPSLQQSYTEYYVGWYRSLYNLDQWYSKDKKFKKFIDEKTTQNPNILNLKSLLITPCQRIPRYSLLIEAISKLTLPSHPDYQGLQIALQKMRSLTEQINERIRDSENLQLVTNIRLKFDDTIGFLDEFHRRLLKESNNLQLLPIKNISSLNTSNNNNNNNNTTNNNQKQSNSQNTDDDTDTDEEDYHNTANMNTSVYITPQKQKSSVAVTPGTSSGVTMPLFITPNKKAMSLLGTPSGTSTIKMSSKKQQSSSLLMSLSMAASKQSTECSLFLFNDLVLLGVPPNCNSITSTLSSSLPVPGKLIAILKVPLASTFIKDYDSQPLIFSIHHHYGSYIFQVATKELKDEWVQTFNDTLKKLLYSCDPVSNVLREKRDKIQFKGSEEEGYHVVDPSIQTFNNSISNHLSSNSSSSSTTNNTKEERSLLTKALSDLHQINSGGLTNTPKKRISMIGKVKQRLSSSLSSPHKSSSNRRNSSFVLNSYEEPLENRL